jgi:hypothetical protein
MKKKREQRIEKLEAEIVANNLIYDIKFFFFFQKKLREPKRELPNQIEGRNRMSIFFD